MMHTKLPYINRPLMGIAQHYTPSGLIARQALPICPVDTLEDAPRMEEYEEYVTEFAITDEQRGKAEVRRPEETLQQEIADIRRAMDVLLLGWEQRVSTLYDDAARYSAAHVRVHTGTAQWNHPHFASAVDGNSYRSSIEAAIDAGSDAIWQSTRGVRANTIIIPDQVGRVMGRDPLLAQILRYTDKQADGLPDVLFGLRVLRPMGVCMGADGRLLRLWGNNVYIAFIDPKPQYDTRARGARLKRDPYTFGATYQLRGPTMERWRDDDAKTTHYRVSIVQDEQLVAPDCGYLLRNVIG